MRTYKQGYREGLWKAQCQRCGNHFRSNQIRREWTGLLVCTGAGTNDCWDPRHPQDFLRGRPDRQAPPWTAPEEDGTDVSIGSGNEVSASDL